MRRVRALNNYILTRRNGRGFTQKELAFLLGCVHRTKVSRYELGIRLPTLKTVIGLEIVLLTPLAKLFAGTYAAVREEIRPRAQQLSRELDAKPRTKAIQRKIDSLSEIIHPLKAKKAA